MKKLLSFTLVCLLVLMTMNCALAEFDPIRRGDKGERVVEIQLILDELGYLDGGVDGAFGAKTEAAVIAFQEGNSLDATGVVGEATYNALLRLSTESSTGDASETVPTPTVPVIATEPSESVVVIESQSDLEIMDAGFDVSYGYLFYSIILHNNSENNAILYPAIRITARNAEGQLMGTEDQVLNLVYPGQDYQWAGMAYFEVSEMPDTVEFEVLEPEDYNIEPLTALEHSEYTPLEVVSISKNGTRFLGEVYNNNNYDIDQIAVVIMFRNEDGVLRVGDVTFVDSVGSNRTVPFDMDIGESLVTDNYQAFAVPWSMY